MPIESGENVALIIVPPLYADDWGRRMNTAIDSDVAAFSRHALSKDYRVVIMGRIDYPVSEKVEKVECQLDAQQLLDRLTVLFENFGDKTGKCLIVYYAGHGHAGGLSLQGFIGATDPACPYANLVETIAKAKFESKICILEACNSASIGLCSDSVSFVASGASKEDCFYDPTMGSYFTKWLLHEHGGLSLDWNRVGSGAVSRSFRNMWGARVGKQVPVYRLNLRDRLAFSLFMKPAVPSSRTGSKGGGNNLRRRDAFQLNRTLLELERAAHRARKRLEKGRPIDDVLYEFLRALNLNERVGNVNLKRRHCRKQQRRF